MSYKQPYDRPYNSSNNMNKYVLANHNRGHLHTEVIKTVEGRNLSFKTKIKIKHYSMNRSDLLNVTLTQNKPNKWNVTGIKPKCSK